MRELIAITVNDLRVFLQDRSNWFFLLIMPMVFVFVIGAVFRSSGGGEAPRIRMDIVDGDHSPAADALIAGLAAANPSLIVCPYANLSASEGENPCNLDADQAQDFTGELAAERLKDGITYATLTLPAGMQAAMLAGETTTLIFSADPSLSAPGIALQAVQSVTTRSGGALVAAGLTTTAALDLNLITEDDRSAFFLARYNEAEAMWGPPPPVVVRTEAIGAVEEKDSEAGFGGGYSQSAPGMAAMYTMINVVGLAAILVQERLDGTLQRLIVMPIRRSQIIGGKILRGCAVGLLQMAIILGLGALLGVHFGSNPIAIIALVLVYVLTIAAMSIFLATISRTPDQATGIALMASMALAPLGGAWWPLAVVPPFMQTIGHISPIAWFMDASNTIIYQNGGLADIMTPLLVLLGFAAVFFALGIRRFRYE